MKAVNPEKILFIVLLLVTVLLRFPSLSYSDYISDEPGTFFYRGGKKNPEMTISQFILTQRKGPLQLFVGYIPYSVVGDYRNELAQRLPFALFGAAAMVVFYFLIKKLTGNFYVAFVSAFLLGTNGLIVAYSRIAQYQNLNMFFSFASLYFFADLLDRKKNALRSSVLGTAMFGLSFLAHWDAIYILLPILYFLVRFAKRHGLTMKFVVINMFVGGLIVLPFLVPYILTYLHLPANADYAEGIYGLADKFKNRDELKYFLVYNPFLTFWVYAVGTAIALGACRRSGTPSLFLAWFLILIIFFRFFVKYSGLHFYNIFIPTTVLVAYAMYYLTTLRAQLWLRIPSALFFIAILGFLFTQSYLLFVDHKVEYPVEDEKVLFWETDQMVQQDNIRHKTGFTHKRFWNQINNFINDQNSVNSETCGYITNEDKTLAKFYMDADANDTAQCFYAISIKRPLSLAYDHKLSNIKNKSTVKTFENASGEVMVRIYKGYSENQLEGQ
ncbi:MAG: Glycosyl transferase family 39 [candidate division WWE3 bacterium GW2011_GWB1_47_11]|uniref:Glycosyl transferase family 39 n=1 Tax=candidate division WWE3 bacterium GW2011_GWB1_47_11 TaxID=1619117 RepID=A0A0G1RJ90_UNCKA|nr:MAG: Glycosyl transferase family 39 [candidate division WWE3 bacterium GW2011_GWB1_47_11]